MMLLALVLVLLVHTPNEAIVSQGMKENDAS